MSNKKMIYYSLLLIIQTLITQTLVISSQPSNGTFFFNGFNSTDLSLFGGAEIAPNGLLTLTNITRFQATNAFYPKPLTLKTNTSFSTTFVFAIRSDFDSLAGHGLAFVMAPTMGLPGASSAQNLGLFNRTNNGDKNNHIVAVEIDTFQNEEFSDIDNNHIGIDINSLSSENSSSAGFYNDTVGGFVNMTLVDGDTMQIWIDYDGGEKTLSVVMAPMSLANKPRVPLLTLRRDLLEVFGENGTFYVGFSSSTGQRVAYHYILGWSFEINGEAKPLVLSPLPELPRRRRPREGPNKLLTIGVPIVVVFVIVSAVLIAFYVITTRRKFAEVVEDWESRYGPTRYKYKDLYMATKGFKDKDILGSGGFGRVFKGVLSATKTEIAVKKVSHESRQGMREFVAELVSIGQLRHRNLVQLLGYCRRKRELMLVYEFMPNGSLDKYLYDDSKTTLNWKQRFRIIKGVASGLFYLHEEWEKVVIHRDVKASNVLLDADFNARIGDFGLARLYDHGIDPQTTHVVGTFGYLAPEHARTGKATTSTDVFSFGAFLLEVACGRRPISKKMCSGEALILVDWVFSFWEKGNIIGAIDNKLELDNFAIEELELVLKLGLLCSHSEPTFRPSMRQVVEYLERHVPLPNLSGLGLSSNGLTSAFYFSTSSKDDDNNHVMSFQCSNVDSTLFIGR